MRVSVVITVLNEADSLPRLLDSLAAQTRPPDEVVVCDGGSTDDTLLLLEAESRLPLRVIRRPGANISEGRNAAIRAATGGVIAVTDAGVCLSPQWLERIVAPFEDAETQVVAGFFRPDPQTVFETAMGATVLPELREINPAHFNPSSRSVAFRKSAWAAVGGYPEWLDYCEDLIFDFRLRDLYGPFVFVPEALVHFRPRSSLRAFFVQYYRYARGDGRADLWRRRHAIRYLTYLVATPLIALAGALVSPWWWALYLISIPGMFWVPWRRLTRMWGGLSLTQKLQAALWVPVIRITGDIAKMIGYPVGVLWRRRRIL
ncbi:MAG: glycosyl transferase family 2 [Chloroflexi bacterium]|nr:MAG: glycosyl transferase family 2 [Chloroflexota bacterium]RLC89540.1 MAG: glycosyl transferase family 2 [Chloroflexota bacterium]HEY67706.1 glycosyltransferase [Thermoflexia bacterium]